MGWCGDKEVRPKPRQAIRSCSQCITSFGCDCAGALAGAVAHHCVWIFSAIVYHFSHSQACSYIVGAELKCSVGRIDSQIKVDNNNNISSPSQRKIQQGRSSDDGKN